MEIEFYRVHGWHKDIWFTNVNPVALCDWAVENGVKYNIEYRLHGRTGIQIGESDRVLFELRWGGNLKKDWDY